jgi:hypothetical protein
MKRVVEILTYVLKQNAGVDFHSIMQDVSVPLHLKNGIDVVAYGNSLHDVDCYYLIRAYESESDRQFTQEKLYESVAWKQGPRVGIIERIEHSTRVVLVLAHETIEFMRHDTQ